MAWKLIETKILWKSWRKQIRTLLKVTFFFGFFNQYADLYWIFVRKVSCHAIQTNFCSKVDSNCYHWKLWRYFEIRCKQFPFEHITSNVEQKRCSFRKLFFAIPKTPKLRSFQTSKVYHPRKTQRCQMEMTFEQASFRTYFNVIHIKTERLYFCS